MKNTERKISKKNYRLEIKVYTGSYYMGEHVAEFVGGRLEYYYD